MFDRWEEGKGYSKLNRMKPSRKREAEDCAVDMG